MAEYTLSAEITPTLSRNFSRDVQRMIKESLAKVDVSVKIKAVIDGGQIQRELNRAVRDAKATVNVKAALDGTQLQRELDRAVRDVKATVAVKTSIDGTQLQREVDRAAREVKASVSIKPIIDSSRLQTDLNRAAGSASSKITITPDLDDKIAKAKLALLTQKTDSAKIRADVDDANAKLKLAKIADMERKAEIKVELNKSSADAFENEASALAKRANFRFNALLFAGLFAGLPGAAAIAGAGVVAGLAGVPLIFTAIGAAALKSNATVKKSFQSLAVTVTSEMQGVVQPIAKPLADAVDQVKATFVDLKPALTAAFNGSGPDVAIFTDGITGLAQRTMPGFITSIINSEAPMRGLRNILTQTGDGLTLFFTNLSAGASSSEGVASTLGGVIKDLLGFTGSLFANLSNGGGPVLAQFRGALSQVEDVILTLTSPTQGLPLLTGAASGFMGTIGGAVSVIQGVASSLGAWAAPLGNIGGALLGTNTVLRLFGTSLGEISGGAGGIKAFQAGVNAAGQPTLSPFKQAMQEANTNGVSKLSKGLSTIVSSGFNPLGLVLAGGGILLDLWGQKSQEAAKRAAEQRKLVSDLTQAYEADNGVIGENVRSLALKAAADKSVFSNSTVFGAATSEVTDAILGQKTAMDEVIGTAKGYVTSLLSSSGANSKVIDTVREEIDTFAKQGGNASVAVDKLFASGSKLGPVFLNAAGQLHELDDAQKSNIVRTLDAVSAIGEQGRAALKAAKDNEEYQARIDHLSSVIAQGLTPAEYAAKASTSALEAAFVKLNVTGGDTVAKGKEIIDIMDHLSGKQKSAEEATQAFNQVIRDLGNNFKDANGNIVPFPKNLVDAAGAINTVTKEGSDLQDVIETAAQDMATYGQALKDSGTPADQIATKLGTMRDALAGQLRHLGLAPAAIQRVLDHYDAIPNNINTVLGLIGDKETQKKLTDLTTQLNTMVDKKNGIHVDALTGEAQDALIHLGESIVRLPDGTFQVFANTEEGRRAAKALAEQVNNTRVAIAIDGNIDLANGKIRVAVQNADGSIGTILIGANINSATGQTMVAVQQANGARGFMTIDAFNDAAKTKVGDAIVVANNAKGFIRVGADVSQALNAITAIVNDKFSTDIIVTVKNPDGSIHRSDRRAYASGGYVSGPGSGTSDSIPALLSNGEFVVTAEATARNRRLLEGINEHKFAKGGLVGYANGGPVKLGDVSSQVWDSLLAKGWKGNPNDRMEALYPPSGGASSGAAASAGISAKLPDPETIKSITAALNELSGASANYTAVLNGLSGASAALISSVIALTSAMLTNTTTITANLLPTLSMLQMALGTVDRSMVDTSTTAVQSWGAISGTVWGSVGAQQAALDNLKGSLAQVRGAFTETANWATGEFGRTYAAAANPIRDVINLPIHALVDAWNSLDGQFALGKHVNAPIAAFAAGGHVSGPGSGTSDSIPALLSDGEFIVKERITKKITPFLTALNAGQPEALKAAGYASGGLVADTGSQLNAATSRGVSFARAQSGKPYIWGGVGPDGYDCSGLISAITNVLRGESNPYQRLGVAESQPWPGFLPGLGSSFATGFNSTHTAGTLAGINVEAAGPPVAFGAGAHGADDPQFTGHAFLPVVGGKFVSGGRSGVDVGAIISQAFGGVQGSINGVTGAYPGNIAAQIGAGMASAASAAIQGQASAKIGSLFPPSGNVPAASGDAKAAQDFARVHLPQFGWGPDQMAPLLSLWNQESGWDANIVNQKSGAYGIPQSLGHGHPFDLGDYANQVMWGMGYIKDRYGSPGSAWAHEVGFNWYDQGGMLKPGDIGVNGLSQPEAVLTPKETAAYQAQAKAAAEGNEMRLDQHSINRLAAAIMAAAERRPIEIRSAGLGLTGGGL